MSLLQINWTVNGILNSTFTNQKFIHPSNTTPGETWACRARAFDSVFPTGSENWTEFSPPVRIGENESSGRQAIEEGIKVSIPDTPVQTVQQIYILNENNQHFLGTFDKSTQKNNQSWAFNYLTEGEPFTNIPSLFTILNIWENYSLTYQEIKNQVETFINQTKEQA
jgi:hypothetical protein